MGYTARPLAGGGTRTALAADPVLAGRPRHLATRRLRKLPAHQAPAQLPVGRIDTGRVHRDPDLAGPSVRIRKIHDLEHLRAPEPAVAGCLITRSDLDPGVSRLLRARQSASLAGRPALGARAAGLSGRLAARRRPAEWESLTGRPRAVGAEGGRDNRADVAIGRLVEIDNDRAQSQEPLPFRAVRRAPRRSRSLRPRAWR